MKTFIKIKKPSGDIFYKIKGADKSINAILQFNSDTRTYCGVKFEIWDGSFSFLKGNEWIYFTNAACLESELLENGFLQTEATRLESLMYG